LHGAVFFNALAKGEQRVWSLGAGGAEKLPSPGWVHNGPIKKIFMACLTEKMQKNNVEHHFFAQHCLLNALAKGDQRAQSLGVAGG
jgi:hypothetical protein